MPAPLIAAGVRAAGKAVTKGAAKGTKAASAATQATRSLKPSTVRPANDNLLAPIKNPRGAFDVAEQPNPQLQTYGTQGKATNDNRPNGRLGPRGRVRRPKWSRLVRPKKRSDSGDSASEEVSLAAKSAARLKATSAAWLIGLFLSPVYMLKFFIWILAVSALVLKATSLFYGLMGIGTILSTFEMLVALSVFLIKKVDCTSGNKLLAFVVFYVLSLMPLFYIIPFWSLWCWSVVYMQTGKRKRGLLS